MPHRKKKWTAGMLSALFPGIGHLYAGDMRRGLFFMLLFVADIASVVFVAMEGVVPLIVLLSLLIPVIWFYALFDSLRAVERTWRLADSEAGSADAAADSDPFARNLVLVGGVLFAGYWLWTGGSGFAPWLGGNGAMIAAIGLVAGGVLLFLFGGSKKK